MNGLAVIVTGASSGMGRAISVQLAPRGFDLWLVGRSTAGLEETAALAVERGGKPPTCVSLDLETHGALAALVTKVGADHPYLFALINNAGVMHPEPVMEGSPDRWRAMFETNLFAPVEANQAAVRAMRRHGRPGKLIAISSLASRNERYGMYSASKKALESANRSLRAELEHDDIRITTIVPGGFKTNLARGFTDASLASLLETASGLGIDFAAPSESIMGDPVHIARVVEMLLDQPSEINLEEIIIRPPVTLDF